jgi:hypothetical protein
MRCFEVTEYVKVGLRVVRGGEPHVWRPEGCPLDIRLHPKTIQVIEEEDDPEGTVLRLERMTLDFAPNMLLMRAPVSDQDQQVLVHVQTAGGVGGKAYLTANVLQEAMERGHVTKRPSAFPSLGVQAFCTDEELARIRDGVEILDVLLLMNPGANFCVRRTGSLEGAPPVLSVRWNGSRLYIDDPKKVVQTRAVPGVAAFAPTEAV